MPELPTNDLRHLEITRRGFCGLLGAGLALAAAWRLPGRLPRVVEALRRRPYPGRVDALDTGSLRRPGRWAG